jgi:hypothetical protein
MKNNIVSALLALMLTGPLAMAQTGDGLVVESLRGRNLVSNDLSTADRIAAARSPYTQPENAASDVTPHITLAQFPGRQLGPRFSPYGGYPRSNYPGMWRGNGSGRHAAVGALIGFGIGAALGAKANKDPHPGVTVKASLLVGSVGGLLGALIGQGAPPYARLQRPRERRTNKRWTDRDETDQDEMASRPNQTDPDTSRQTSAQEGTPELNLAARPSNSKPASADTPATP